MRTWRDKIGFTLDTTRLEVKLTGRNRIKQDKRQTVGGATCERIDYKGSLRLTNGEKTRERERERERRERERKRGREFRRDHGVRPDQMAGPLRLFFYHIAYFRVHSRATCERKTNAISKTARQRYGNGETTVPGAVSWPSVKR